MGSNSMAAATGAAKTARPMREWKPMLTPLSSSAAQINSASNCNPVPGAPVQ
jgi:hypothetical protein